MGTHFETLFDKNNENTVSTILFLYLVGNVHFLKTSVTLEPVIILYTFAAFVLDGSKITTNLLIFKICNLTDFTNITEIVDCSNITWISEQDQVMKDVNSFQVIS